jgi:hypothetical protein
MGVQCAPLAIVKMLFEHCPAPQHGHLLHRAAVRSREDCVAVMQLVFDHFHPDVNSIRYADHAFAFALYKVMGLGTAFHEAARSGRPETIIWSLDHGADPTIPDSNGRTPAEAAEWLGNAPATEYLKRCAGASAPKV